MSEKKHAPKPEPKLPPRRDESIEKTANDKGIHKPSTKVTNVDKLPDPPPKKK